MPVIVVGTEKNLAALKPRLFEGSVSAKATKEVHEAIAEANPHANLDALEPGTILTVPDLPKVAIRGDLSLDEPSKEAVASLAAQSRTALADIVAAGKTVAKEAAAANRKTVKALNAKEAVAALRKEKPLGLDLKALEAAVAEEDEASKARAAALTKAQTEWAAELKALEQFLPTPEK
jgi:hypothetical protein